MNTASGITYGRILRVASLENGYCERRDLRTGSASGVLEGGYYEWHKLWTDTTSDVIC